MNDKQIARELVTAAKELVGVGPRFAPPFKDLKIGDKFKWKRKLWVKKSNSLAVMVGKSQSFDEWESVEPV